MSDADTGVSDEIDVARIMEAIRAGIAVRRDKLPIDEAVTERLQDLADSAEFDAELLEPLLRGGTGWNVNPDYRIATHRVGLQAMVVVACKGFARFVTRFYTDPLVERQAQVNLYLLRAVEALLAETTRLHRAIERARGGEDR